MTVATAPAPPRLSDLGFVTVREALLWLAEQEEGRRWPLWSDPDGATWRLARGPRGLVAFHVPEGHGITDGEPPIRYGFVGVGEITFGRPDGSAITVVGEDVR